MNTPFSIIEENESYRARVSALNSSLERDREYAATILRQAPTKRIRASRTCSCFKLIRNVEFAEILSTLIIIAYAVLLPHKS